MFFNDRMTTKNGFYQDPWRSSQFSYPQRQRRNDFFGLPSKLNNERTVPNVRKNKGSNWAHKCDCQDCSYRRYLELEREREISRPNGIQNRQKVRRNPERSEKLSETQENHLKTQKTFRVAKTHEEPREAKEIPILGLRKSRSSEKLDNNQNATSSRKSTTMRNSDQPKAQKIGSRKNLEEEPILVELEYPEKLENSELEVDEEIIIEPDS